MKRITALVLGFLANAQLISAQSSRFTYQGRLESGGAPAQGVFDLRFALFDAATDGAPQGNTLTNVATVVSNGLFRVTLDFGDQFPGDERWLEIGVRTNGGSAFQTLAPRQSVTSTPYAVRAVTAGTAASAHSVAATNIAGTLPVAQLPAEVITNGASGVHLAGFFTGNGAGITNVDVSRLRQPVQFPVAWGYSVNVVGQSVVPAGLNHVVAIAAGGNHSLALKGDGTVVEWGGNSSGVPAGLSDVTAISAGYNFSLALKRDGTVAAWGDNQFGQSTPPFGLSNVVAIAAGHFHSLALKEDGTVVGWADGLSGPADVPPGLNDVVAISGGYNHSLALKRDGTVVVWGTDSGQTAIPQGLNSVVAISAGSFHNLALKSDGTVAAWGMNFSGQMNIPAGLTNVVAIAAGEYFSLALKSDGTVVAWGHSDSIPARVPAGLSNVVAIAVGDYHHLALRREQAPVALLTGDNVFQGTVVAVGFKGDGSGLTNLDPQLARLDARVNFTGITSPKWNVSTPINTNQALPVTGTFSSGGGTLLISVSGSGYTATAGVIGMDVRLDGTVIDSCLINANATFSHMAFVPKTIVRSGVAAGAHTLTLTARNGTLTSAGIDYFSVTVTEFPF